MENSDVFDPAWKDEEYDSENGLSPQQVRERVGKGAVNESVDSSTRTYGEIVKSNVFTYFNLIFVILALLLLIVGSFKDMTFLGVIFFNTVIGIAQEFRLL